MEEEEEEEHKCRICGQKATKKLKATAEATTCNKHFQPCYDAFKNSIENVRLQYLIQQQEQEEEEEQQQEQQQQQPPKPQPEPQPTPQTGQDKYGIKKLYHDDNSAPQMIYMDMDNPTKDSFLNKEERANMRKESDGSWSLDGKDTGKYQVRLGLWMNPPQTDIEATVYANFIEAVAGQEAGSYAFQLYKGVGDHSTSNNGCTGFSYKGRVRHDKSVVVVKEITHPNYTSNQGGIKKLTKDPKGNYIGTKLVTYNIRSVRSGRTPVKIEMWCDEEGMDKNGILHPELQKWVKMAEYIDVGGWSAGSAASVGNCEPLEVGNITGKRRTDEIYNLPVGTPNKGNIVTYRTDGVRTKIKHFSVRKIKSPVGAV